ncbi:hypothetical protein TWF569_008434 [Orbilia oligospora]|uniref:Uncharacterized protein n=1 Tax=Orbilia oligospora TaxID=2813651 RepID=A0A7C8J3Y3_ORBOL|nr:hypothetical protein TWF102_002995 [Orbilia oligospora]KAF3139581.1 hypothetical protein TWF569_008434 [Orbilia oligospora]
MFPLFCDLISDITHTHKLRVTLQLSNQTPDKITGMAHKDGLVLASRIDFGETSRGDRKSWATAWIWSPDSKWSPEIPAGIDWSNQWDPILERNEESVQIHNKSSQLENFSQGNQ